jgi:uncharacterized protein (TIGR03067 family)
MRLHTLLLLTARSLMRIPALTLLAAAAFLPAGDAAQTDDARKELARLEGTWHLVGREIEGKKATPEEVKKVDATLIIKGDKFTYKSQGAEVWQAVLKIDPTKTPRMIAATHVSGPLKGKTGQAVYKLEGDRLTVCFSYTKRPTDFTTSEGSDRVLVVYQRAQK